MAATILSVGPPEGAVFLELAQHGYDLVRWCNSTARLNDLLNRGEFDAVLVTEDTGTQCKDILTISRSTSVPLILFSPDTTTVDQFGFDIVISPNTPRDIWLTRIRKAIERSRQLRLEAKLAADRAAHLRDEVTSLIEDSAAIITSMRHSRTRSFGEISTGPARVLVVDDHEKWRHVVRSVLSHFPDAQFVGEAEDGLMAVRLAAELNPDLIVLDVGLPHLSGIEAAKQIREMLPEARIIFLTMCKDTAIMHKALNSGAKAYVLKIHAARELRQVLEEVLQDDSHVIRCAVPNP